MLPRCIRTKGRLEAKILRERERDNEKGYGSCRQLPVHQPKLSPRRSTGLTEDWMRLLGDDTLLSAITIPGTHDSAAFTYSLPFVATQKMDIAGQLDAGIRYFDLRCGVRDDVPEMVHGPQYLGLRLKKVLRTMYQWLDRHPTEALIVQIKEDRKRQRSKMHFAQAIWSVLSTNLERWRTDNTIPTLGGLRGRIQLFRRFVGPTLVAWGMDVSQWMDNPTKPFTIYTMHGVQVTVQDHYKFAGAEPLPSLVMKKGGNVAELLDRAHNDEDPDHWYINFTSAFEFNLFYQLTPHEVAVGEWWGFRWVEGINVRLRAYLSGKARRRGRLGIVAMDYPEQGPEDLISALVRTNFDSRFGRHWNNLAVWIVLLLLAMLTYSRREILLSEAVIRSTSSAFHSSFSAVYAG